jgi:hypothetical protein
LGVQWNNDNIDFYSHMTENAIMEILYPPEEKVEPKMFQTNVLRAFRSRE